MQDNIRRAIERVASDAKDRRDQDELKYADKKMAEKKSTNNWETIATTIVKPALEDVARILKSQEWEVYVNISSDSGPSVVQLYAKPPHCDVDASMKDFRDLQYAKEQADKYATAMNFSLSQSGNLSIEWLNSSAGSYHGGYELTDITPELVQQCALEFIDAQASKSYIRCL